MSTGLAARLKGPAPKRHAVDALMLDLPMPISVNRLWAGNGQGSLRTTAAYKAWINEAGWALIEQHPGCVHGRYRLHIEISRTGTKADLGNFEKGVSDLLQAHGVIENDRLAEEIHIAWSDELTNQCRVTIFSLPLREQGGG